MRRSFLQCKLLLLDNQMKKRTMRDCNATVRHSPIIVRLNNGEANTAFNSY